MSTWPPRKINILTVSQSVKDLCKCRPDRRERSTFWLHSHSSEIFVRVWHDKMSTWPPRMFNILTDSQSSKIRDVWVCDKDVDLTAAKNQHPNCQSIVKDVCMSPWQNVDLFAAKQSVVKDLCHETVTYMSICPRKINILTDSQSVKDLCMSLWQVVDVTAVERSTS